VVGYFTEQYDSSTAFLGLAMIALVALAIVAALIPETRARERNSARYAVAKRRSGAACSVRLR
jgi:hypothetical protein